MTTTALAVFLLARLEEDEAAAKGVSADKWALATDGWWGSLAEHIARHDPARVLAEVKAKRAIVELHVSTSDRSEPWDDACSGETYLASPDGCPTLRILAAIWSDHEAWDESWAL